MLRNNIIVIIMALFFYAPSSFASESGFDKVCGYFKQLQVTLRHKPMSNKQRTKFMNNLINKNFSSDSTISQSWYAILYAVKNQRYGIFKGNAKDVGGLKNWSCAPMKALYPTVGY